MRCLAKVSHCCMMGASSARPQAAYQDWKLEPLFSQLRPTALGRFMVSSGSSLCPFAMTASPTTVHLLAGLGKPPEERRGRLAFPPRFSWGVVRKPAPQVGLSLVCCLGSVDWR